MKNCKFTPDGRRDDKKTGIWYNVVIENRRDSGYGNAGL